MTQALAILPNWLISWDPLPPDYQLPDDPVDNFDQPILAAALREALKIAERITPTMLIATNFGICATVNGELVIKAPDWVYIPSVHPLPPGITRTSYTPQLDGDFPEMVMEFISKTPGGEYDTDSTFPYGKWFFYEQILQVPWYVIFNPATGAIEVYQFRAGRYRLQQPNEKKRYWLAPLKLFLGVWSGTDPGDSRTGYWLRWWDRFGKVLPWGSEQWAWARRELQRERQEKEHEQQEKERERQEKEHERHEKELAWQKLKQLRERLRAAGIDPDDVP